MVKDEDEKRSLLIVDDDAGVLDFIQQGLLSEGYHCQTAATAESALEHIHKTPFDLMLTDIVMPGMDGFKLTLQFRQWGGEIVQMALAGRFFMAFVLQNTNSQVLYKKSLLSQR